MFSDYFIHIYIYTHCIQLFCRKFQYALHQKSPWDRLIVIDPPSSLCDLWNIPTHLVMGDQVKFCFPNVQHLRYAPIAWQGKILECCLHERLMLSMSYQTWSNHKLLSNFPSAKKNIFAYQQKMFLQENLMVNFEGSNSSTVPPFRHDDLVELTSKPCWKKRGFPICFEVCFPYSSCWKKAAPIKDFTRSVGGRWASMSLEMLPNFHRQARAFFSQASLRPQRRCSRGHCQWQLVRGWRANRWWWLLWGWPMLGIS